MRKAEQLELAIREQRKRVSYSMKNEDFRIALYETHQLTILEEAEEIITFLMEVK